MQEEEVEEVLKMMTEKMLAMNQRIEVLNERQNDIDNSLPEQPGSDAGKQLHIDGL